VIQDQIRNNIAKIAKADLRQGIILALQLCWSTKPANAGALSSPTKLLDKPTVFKIGEQLREYPSDSDKPDADESAKGAAR
jgi:hypothetical protein